LSEDRSALPAFTGVSPKCSFPFTQIEIAFTAFIAIPSQFAFNSPDCRIIDLKAGIGLFRLRIPDPQIGIGLFRPLKFDPDLGIIYPASKIPDPELEIVQSKL
jgi:hypothetical protein